MPGLALPRGRVQAWSVALVLAAPRVPPPEQLRAGPLPVHLQRPSAQAVPRAPVSGSPVCCVHADALSSSQYSLGPVAPRWG